MVIIQEEKTYRLIFYLFFQKDLSKNEKCRESIKSKSIEGRVSKSHKSVAKQSSKLSSVCSKKSKNLFKSNKKELKKTNGPQQEITKKFYIEKDNMMHDINNNKKIVKETEISFNYNTQKEKNPKYSDQNFNPSLSVNDGNLIEFDKCMRDDLQNKFKNSQFSKEIDCEKFQKSLDIILTMNNN